MELAAAKKDLLNAKAADQVEEIESMERDFERARVGVMATVKGRVRDLVEDPFDGWTEASNRSIRPVIPFRPRANKIYIYSQLLWQDKHLPSHWSFVCSRSAARRR